MSYKEFKIENDRDWKHIHKKIFGDAIPKHCEWTNLDDIISVLNNIGQVEGSNHMFFPDSGGLDLKGSKKSNEKEAVELMMGVSYIVKPRRLIFEYIDDDFEWNYFRLETGDLAPSGVYEHYSDDFKMEEVLELRPGKYIKRHYWDAGTYNDEILPKNARPVVRYFRGAFVIFKKTSIYNNNPGTYDARHEKLGSEGFKKHIIAAYEQFKK